MSLALCIVAANILPSCTKSHDSIMQGDSSVNNGLQTQVEFSPEEYERAMFIPGTAVVKFSEQMTQQIERGLADPMSSISADLGFSHMERLFPDAGEWEPRTRAEGLHTFYLVDFDPQISLSKAQALMESVDGVEIVEKRHQIKSTAYTNDPRYSSSWEYTSADYSIHVEEAWPYTMGDPRVIVCVVDDGIQQDHEDLAWNCSKVDNYNFVKNNTTIVAGDHGTHVGGTIGAVGNNGVGFVGIAGGDYKAGKRGVTLLSAQVFQGNSSARSFENAIKWGADHGAVISQNSWGNNYDFNGDGVLSGQELQYALNDKISSSIKAAVDYFIKYAGCDNKGEKLPDSPMKGGIVVFAAGNDGIVNGVPANYDPIISVGCSNKNGRLSSFSNHGPWVDICAPGESTFSTVPGNKYASMSGTSMACPHVSGSLALLLSNFLDMDVTNADLEEILKAGATHGLINCNGKDMGPYLNVYASLQYGMEKYKRAYNNDPVIETPYQGDFVFRQWETVSIPFYITDPDGDRLSVKSEIEGRGRFVQSEENEDQYNFSLLCELVNDFTPKNARIVAEDNYEGYAEYSFTYQVLKNRAPELAKQQDDLLLPSSGKVQVDLAPAFTDADEEKLTYSVNVNPSNLVKATLDGSNLTLQKLGNGLSTVTVTAKDYMGEVAKMSFKTLSRDENYEVDYYPNPVKDFLNIRTASVSKSNVDVTILSASGALMFKQTLECSAFNPGRVDMTTYAPGQYTLKLVVSGKEYQDVIIKR